jgi:potassium-dependent mechanosensitive channel
MLQARLLAQAVSALSRWRKVVVIMSAVLVISAWQLVYAQDRSPATTAPAAQGLTGAVVDDGVYLAARLQALKAEAETYPSPNKDDDARAAEQIDRGLAAHARMAALSAESTRLTSELDGAPARLAAQRETLAKRLSESKALDVPWDTAPWVAAGELRVANVAVDTARQRLAEITERRAELRQQPDRSRQQLITAKGVLAEIRAAEKLPAQAGASMDSSFASRVGTQVLAARKQARQAEIALLEQQLATYDQRLEYLGAELEVAQQQSSVAEARAQAWQKVVQGQRAKEAARNTREARQTEESLAAMPANVRRTAERATEMARTIVEITRKEGEVTRQLASAETRLQELRDDLSSVQQRVAVAGLNESIGLVLRKQQERLPTLAAYRAQAAQWRRETSWASGIQIDLDGLRLQFSKLGKVADEIFAESDPPLAPVAIAYYRPRLEEVLVQIKEMVEPLHSTAGRYIKLLGRLDNAERQLVSQAEQYNKLISEHLLWVRSTSVISTAIVGETWTAFRWLIAPANWRAVANTLNGVAEAEPLRTWALVLLLGLLIGSRSWLRRVIENQSAKTLKVRTDHFGRTIFALATAVASALAPALIFLVLGWHLQAHGGDEEFVFAVGIGLERLAYIVWGFYLLAVLLRDHGVGAVQFGWPAAARRSLFRNLCWLMPVVLSAWFCIWVAEAQDNEQIRASLGRMAFIVVMVALSVFLLRVLRPSGALLTALAERTQSSLVVRLQYVWVALASAAPLSLAVLSASGFHYSALQLQTRLQSTAWIISGLVLASESLLRWLTLVRRRAAYQQAVDERLAARRARLAAADTDATDDEVVEIKEPEFNIEDAERQAGSVVRAAIGIGAVFGLWAAWADVLPALNSLNDVVMWQSPRVVDGAETQVPVTLVDLAVAMLIASLAYVGAKNVPGALELVLLNQINLDAGAKYAFSSLLRYVIVGVGITVVFNQLGMQWARLQWFVAALSVGLGFGLQEIVANFVSGLILLFERPIRIGDVVTVNGATGTVSRIQIRATTLVDFDRKELIMPNKVFITGEVLNWTLSDHSTRIVVNVGVAYGSDTRAAMEHMLKVAREHPLTMNEPEPVATFEGFGDNSLNLVLRCYMASLEGRLSTITELHNGINDAFNEAGIEISFPQRDVHLDSLSPLKIQLERRRPDASGESA